MDTIKYNTRLKASGDEYRKIVFWNRFIRNPIETVLSLVPVAIAIALMVMGFFNMCGGTDCVFYQSAQNLPLGKNAV